MLKKYIFRLSLLSILCCGLIKPAAAISFADFAYKKAAQNKIEDIRPYLRKGYRIDTPDTKGETALCRSIQKENYQAYQKLRRLGANPRHYCMRYVNQQTARDFASQYQPKNFAPVANEAQTDSTLKYAGAGILAVGATAGAIALFDNGGSSKHQAVTPSCPPNYTMVNGKCELISCEAGTHWVNGKCEPLNCPEGTVIYGNTCVEESQCPPGETWNGNECIAIVCPENTHLVGNSCVADQIQIDNNNDNDVIAINSDLDKVYNLRSTPDHPNNESVIKINNAGNGNVTGIKGRSDIFNAIVIKENNGYSNPLYIGTGIIDITNHGSGAVRGIHAEIEDITQYKQAMNAAAENKGESNGYININHTGGGNTYGIFGDVRAYNAYAASGGIANGNITIRGDGNIYGISGYVAAANAVSPFFGHKVTGNINLYGEGNGDIYGIMISKDDIPGAGAGGGNLASWFAFNAYASGGDVVEGNINIRNNGNGNAYGMYGGQQLYNAMPGSPDENGDRSSISRGNINILNAGNGDAYGMYIPDQDSNAVIANIGTDGASSTINIVNVGNGTAYGMRGGKENSITNSGVININNLGDGTAIGIYGEEDSKIHNSGTINITHQTYTDPETGKIYRPQNTYSGTAYGIYAKSGASVINSGDITITGAAKGQGIFLEDGATLVNNGKVTFNGAVQNAGTNSENIASAINLDDLGGEIILDKNGQFFAEQLAGNLSVSENAVLNSFENEYVLQNSLQAENIDNLKLNSKSAMFKTETKSNDANGYDVVMTRQNFNDLLDDKNIAAFLENNYKDENGAEIYNILKQSETNKELRQNAANLHGTDVLPSFRRENALVYRHLNRQFNDNLFNRPDEHYIGGYKYIDISMDEDDTLSGSDGTANAAYGMLTGKTGSGVIYGLGATATNIKSDFDNGAKHKSNVFGLWAPVGYDFQNGAKWVSKAYLGYADGSYDRKTPLGKYSADTKEYQYGISNEMRYKMNLGGGFSLEPTAELNFLGVYQDSVSEGNNLGSLHIDSGNTLSLEGALGAYLGKDFQISESGKLGIQIGGVYYVEFLDPDDGMDASISGMSGKFKLKNKAQSDRALLSLRMNYNYKNLTLYGMIEKETCGSKAFTIDAGLQYKF